MVQSAAPTVDAYLAEVEPGRLPAILRLREECRARLTGWEEKMQWGMPGYGPPGGDARISFNSQVRHISLYIGKGAIERHQASLRGVSVGKGCIRYPNPDKIDFDLVGAMLTDSFQAKGGVS